MAVKTFYGIANAVAQKTTVQITGYDGATTYTVTVGDNGFTEAIGVAGDTDVNATATALAAAWNASTHPYCTVVTAAAATDTVTFTADTAGCPFTIASSVTGGGGTIGAASTTTASASKFDLGTAANYDAEALPVNSDTINFHPDVQSVHWGLEQAWTGMVVNLPASVRVGLRSSRFAIAEDADTYASDEEHEYRQTYMQFDMASLVAGDDSNNTGVTRTAATRQKIDNTKAAASTTFIYKANGTSSEAGIPVFRMLAAHADADVTVYEATGGFGIAVDEPGETSTIGDIIVSNQSAATRVYTGAGVFWATYTQDGPCISKLRQSGGGAITAIYIRAGSCETLGPMGAITFVDVSPGALYYYSSLSTIATLENAGTVDCTREPRARTITKYRPVAGGILKRIGTIPTLTAISTPAQAHTITITGLHKGA